MTENAWSDIDRDKVYTELCEAVTRVGEDKEALYLSRACLLLIEALGSRDAASRAIADAEADLAQDADARGISYRI